MSRNSARTRINDALYLCHSCRARRDFRPLLHAKAQRRWLTRNHIANIQTAEQEWTLRAKEIVAGTKKSILNVLEERGYVNQIVGQRDILNNLLIHRRVGVYAGFDPTAPSLHVGHMIPLMVLSWFYIHGYAVHYLLGGTTARFGDPTDRLTARAVVSPSTRKANMASMHVQLKNKAALMEKHADRKGYTREWAWKRALINNNEWWNSTTLPEFMRVMGSVARIGPMLGRDTVKNRMEKGDGMSFAEFTYPLLQAWDWWELYQKGVQIQVGGSDQFGNILAGAEAVKAIIKANQDTKLIGDMKHHGGVDKSFGALKTKYEEENNVSNQPMGFTVPLLTTAAGEKFGKSAGNAVWLDRDMTSSFDLYQFFLRTADADVERYLKLFTFLSIPEISRVMEQQHKDESKRVAQHRLAREFVELVHGLPAAEEAEIQHRTVFKRDLSLKDVQDAANQLGTSESTSVNKNPVGVLPINPAVNKYAPATGAEDMGGMNIKLPSSLVRGQPFAKILWSAGLVVSRSEGQRLIAANGVHIGGKKGSSETLDDSLSYRRASDVDLGPLHNLDRFIIDGDLLILRVGKWKHRFIKIVPDEQFEQDGLTCPGWKDERGPDAGRGVGFKEESKLWQQLLKGKKGEIDKEQVQPIRKGRGSSALDKQRMQR